MNIQEILAELKQCVSNLEAFAEEESSEPKEDQVKFHQPADEDESSDMDMEDEQNAIPPSFGGGRKARVANYEKSRKNIRKAMKEE